MLTVVYFIKKSVCVKADGKLSEEFVIDVGVRQGCVMPLWLFNIYIYGLVREMKAKSGYRVVRMRLDRMEWQYVAKLFADDTMLFAEGQIDLWRAVDVFHSVCERRNLKVNAGKCKVMVFEKGKITDCSIKL